MELENRSQEICSVGVAEENKLVRVEPVTCPGALNEGSKRFGFAANIGLVECRGIETAAAVGGVSTAGHR